MSDPVTRRDFLRRGSALVASGLAVPAAVASTEETSQGKGKKAPKGQAKPEKTEPAGVAEELKRFAELSDGETPKWLDWYGKYRLRVLFDIAVTDAPPEALSKLDPEDIVATIVDAGLKGLMFYVQCPTGWLYYPSKVGHEHPRLKGRDIIGEVVTACHKRNMKFIGYYVLYEMGVEYTRHPNWRVEWIGEKGPTAPRLWGNLCFNRPGCWEFMQAMVRESLSKYDMDAVFLDNWGHRECGCADCQRRYKAETRRELPHYITTDPDDPAFSAYLHHVHKWVTDWAVDMRRIVKEARPNCVLTFQYTAGYGGGGRQGYGSGMAEVADGVAEDSNDLVLQYQCSLGFKCLRSFNRYAPFESHIQPAEHHSDEMSAKQEGYLKQLYAYILAQDGIVSYDDDMCWNGRISKKKYQRAKQINPWAAERFPYLGGVMVADVGIYLSHESNAYPHKTQHWRWWPGPHGAERSTETSKHTSGNVAFTEAMIRENIPFDLIHPHKLRELGRHKIIYMNNVEVLGDNEAAAVREFVNAGGGLVITHRTGMRDEKFQARGNFALADLMGADYLETPVLADSFIFAEPADRAEGFFVNLHPEGPYFEVHGPQCYVKPRTGVRTVGKIARPRRPLNEEGWPRPDLPPTMQLLDGKEPRQALLHMYAPEIITEYAPVVLNQYGKGRVAYFAGVPCYDYIDDIHDLMVALLHWAAGGKLDPTIASNAPGPVEIITMEQLKNNRTVVHAINWQTHWPGVKATDVEVALKKFGRRPKRAFAVEAKQDVQLTTDGARARLTFPPIQAWETVVVEWV
jgi:hypothetical protein